MPIRKISRGATRAYTTGVKTIGKTTNAFMKPVTRKMTKIVRKTPLVGRPAALAVSVPRKITKAAIAAGLAIPKAAGRIATTGRNVFSRVMLDPLLAMGAGSPLVVLGLSPSGKLKRITAKKSAKKPAKKSRARK
tara:strand:+ start:297 stop:701 length:405 start_codon:yes stop_codon:yes gene_type:complete